MGLPAARLADLCTGHSCFPPRPNRKASENVFINSRGAHRKTDDWKVHCCIVDCHEGITTGGSGSVFVNSLAAARVQDEVDCGSYIMSGSHNVYIGD